MPPVLAGCFFWSWRASSPRKQIRQRASLKDNAPTEYAAANSPLEWLVTAQGVIPDGVRTYSVHTLLCLLPC